MTKSKERPKEFPAETYKSWSHSCWAHWTHHLSVTGSAQDIKREVSRVSAWEEVKPFIAELKKEAKKLKVEGLHFEVTSRMEYEDSSIEIKACGFRKKTEKEMVVGETTREKTRQRKEAVALRKIAEEKKQLLELQKKYPDLG